MKIALVSDWFAPRRGGIEAQLTELAGRLARRGHDVHVLTTTPDAREGRTDGYHVHAIPSVRLPFTDVAVSPTLISRVARELTRGYDVVHAHVSVVSPLAYASLVAARSTGIPALATFHSVLHAKRWLLSFADVSGGLSSMARVWSGVSDLVSSQLRAALARANVMTLPNATDIEFWRASDGATSRPPLITFVSTSRLHRKKRPLALLDAFAFARPRFTRPARLILLGEGSQDATVQRHVRALELTWGDAHVELRGWIARSELRALYLAADAFVLASRHESFGIASLEARAAGLPVIAMRAAGSTEFLRNETDALLCDDDAELVSSMLRIVNDAALRERLRAPSAVLSRYDWSSVLSLHEATYAHVIAGAQTERAVVGVST
jgi:glycosyltransferase involved in cell wall biosynthesis